MEIELPTEIKEFCLALFQRANPICVAFWLPETGQALNFVPRVL